MLSILHGLPSWTEPISRGPGLRAVRLEVDPPQVGTVLVRYRARTFLRTLSSRQRARASPNRCAAAYSVWASVNRETL